VGLALDENASISNRKLKTSIQDFIYCTMYTVYALFCCVNLVFWRSCYALCGISCEVEVTHSQNKEEGEQKKMNKKINRVKIQQNQPFTP
jgi:hypothetical protein